MKFPVEAHFWLDELFYYICRLCCFSCRRAERDDKITKLKSLIDQVKSHSQNEELWTDIAALKGDTVELATILWNAIQHVIEKLNSPCGTFLKKK
jgi:hypothetical protein